MSLGTALLILLIIALLGGFRDWGSGPGYGYGGGGISLVGAVVIVVLILVLTGRF